MIPHLPYGCSAAHSMRMVRMAEFGRLRVTETVYAPGERLPNHAHSRPALVFVLEGGFTEVFGHPRAFRPRR